MIDYHRQDDKSPPPLREPECYCFEVTQQIKTIMVNHVCFPDDGTLSVGDGFDFTATNTGQRYKGIVTEIADGIVYAKCEYPVAVLLTTSINPSDKESGKGEQTNP